MSSAVLTGQRGQPLEIVVAGPSGGTCVLIGFYGIDGVNRADDESSDSIAFPLTMEEGPVGFYSCIIYPTQDGPHWADFTIGQTHGCVLARIGELPLTAGLPWIPIAAVDSSSLSLTLADADGSPVGTEDGQTITYPVSMTLVSNRPGRWYGPSVVFPEGMKVRGSLAYGSTVDRFVLSVLPSADEDPSGRMDGFRATTTVVADDWISIGTIMKWTGWGSGATSRMRDLRRLAIDTFIDRTHLIMPKVEGTYHGLWLEAGVIGLPMPMVLPSSGGAAIVVEEIDAVGNAISVPDQAWMVLTDGYKLTTPVVMFPGYSTSVQGQFRVTGTWGAPQLRIKVTQALIGLIRWHSLSYGEGPDQAIEQSRFFRITDEATRDRRVNYASSAIGDGLTGDRTTDRLLAELTIRQPARVSRYCDQG